MIKRKDDIFLNDPPTGFKLVSACDQLNKH